MEGAKNGGMFQFVAGAVLAVVGYALGWTGIGAVVGSIGVSMMVGGIAQMLTPTPKSPTSSHADNGKASVYFSSVDNMIAQGNPVPIPYGEIMCGSRVISQEITTRDESTPDKVIHIGGIFGKLLEKQREALGLPITKPRVLIR
ncbi:tail assembly protein [Salmonella enterica]|nr:tail assembly protein [Salmonella enterica]